jgi:hypothetical protein
MQHSRFCKADSQRGHKTMPHVTDVSGCSGPAGAGARKQPRERNNQSLRKTKMVNENTEVNATKARPPLVQW